MLTAQILILLSAACTNRSALPNFGDPRSDDYTELASGETTDKDSHYFWVFGGDEAFSSWQKRAEQTFIAHGWSVTANVLFFAAAPDDSLCLSYRDLDKDDRSTAAVRAMVRRLEPGVLEDNEGKYSALMFVTAGKCV